MPAYGIAIRNRSLKSNHGLLCWKDFLTAETLNVTSRDLCGRGSYYVNCNVPELNLKPSSSSSNLWRRRKKKQLKYVRLLRLMGMGALIVEFRLKSMHYR